MTKSLGAAAIIAFVIAPLGAYRAIAGDAPDIVLSNGRIFTGVKDGMHAEALAVRGDRIVAVGKNAEIIKLAAPKTQRIDLHGATVIPGINDAHYHLDISPSDGVNIGIASHNPSWNEVRDAVAAAAAKAPAGTLLAGVIGPA